MNKTEIQGFLVSHHILSLKLQMTSKFSFIHQCPGLPNRPEWESLLKTLTTEIRQNIKLRSKYKIKLHYITEYFMSKNDGKRVSAYIKTEP